MSNILTYPLNGVTYDAEDTEIYNCTRTSGVFAEEGHFSATITGRLEISIGPGLAWIQNEEFHGKAIYNPEPEALAIEEADAHLTRIDRIVLQFDKLMNQTTLVVKTGTPASRPVAPEITRSSYIYELGLYNVTVKYSTLSLSNDCLESTILDENVCGLMRDGVTRLPTQQLYDQWYAWFVGIQNNYELFEEQLQQWFYGVRQDFENWEGETKQEFEEWFDTVKDVLDENTAGKLQNEIDALKESGTKLQDEIDTLKENETKIQETIKESETKFQDAIDTLEGRVEKLESLLFKYFVVYSEDDFSVTFYGDATIPEVGDRYKGKDVTYLFTGENDDHKWSDLREVCQRVSFDKSFSGARPTSMIRWFDNFSVLTSVDFTNLNTSDVTAMGYLLNGCGSLKTLDLSPLDTGNVSSMCCVFMNCRALTTMDLSPLNTASVNDISFLFNGCSGLTSIELGELNVRNATDMTYMFAGCSSLASIDLSQMDTSNVQSMWSMFNGCTSIETIYSDDNKFVTTNVSSSSSMFLNCTNLVGGNGTKYDPEKVKIEMAHVDTAENPGYFTAKT